ncbi:hypothetical protein PU629_02920 [Pullulanibacillus sp. KACC 23026]|uniref:hypothetical protein n=1 Tax=Pullulanibacillus sp. KACC 23026 TaxID=3028315 RepID=UPI0023B07929|nr:hypothetical protein [Pullulanibacillus sp. KACC 23026]WEG13333.1 hypothetical protein PU629_02920 [Pullulanibacillus sp. KACC 23026]
MGPEYYRNLIEREHMNKPVNIRLHDGSMHQGIVRRVDNTHVHLEPIDGAGGVNGLDGPGVYAWGFGFGFPIALASIAAIGALSWLWW